MEQVKGNMTLHSCLQTSGEDTVRREKIPVTPIFPDRHLVMPDGKWKPESGSEAGGTKGNPKSTVTSKRKVIICLSCVPWKIRASPCCREATSQWETDCRAAMIVRSSGFPELIERHLLSLHLCV
jgi:hypothetical protein